FLAAVVDAELHFRGGERALVRDPEAALGVGGVDVERLALVGFPLAVDELLFLLALGAPVLEAGVVEVDFGGTSGHVEPVAGAHAPVGLVGFGQARNVLGDDFAVVVFLLEGDLDLLAVGLDVEAVDRQAAGVADVGGVGDVARIVLAVAGVGLVFPRHQFHVLGIVVAVAAFDLGVVAVLHADPGQQAATERLAGGHRAEGRLLLAIVGAHRADADVAAVELVGVAQHDVDRAGHGIAGAVGAVAAQDFHALDHLGRDAVDP